jgi:Ca2+/Na+ antiporter
LNSYISIEPLEEDERAFIQKKRDTESKAYMYTMNRMLVIAFIVPLFVAIVYYIVTVQISDLVQVYFIGLIFLLLFFALVAWLSYRHKLMKYKNDLKKGTKCIERVTIQSAQYMPQNNTYHFYIDSIVKLSIEVDEIFYHSNHPGDEINIEYAQFSHEFFGYF